jgi:hypothetical protein
MVLAYVAIAPATNSVQSKAITLLSWLSTHTNIAFHGDRRLYGLLCSV